MKFFLMIYDRTQGTTQVTEFTERDDATAATLAANIRHSHDKLDQDIILFGADSLEDLKANSHWFRDVEEL